MSMAAKLSYNIHAVLVSPRLPACHQPYLSLAEDHKDPSNYRVCKLDLSGF